jgi:hypothetical protein
MMQRRGPNTKHRLIRPQFSGEFEISADISGRLVETKNRRASAGSITSATICARAAM